MAKQYIGGRKIKHHENTKETTHGGTPLVRVEFANGDAEFISKLTFDNVVTENPIEPTELRERRVDPVIEKTLALLREHTILIGDLSYFALKLNQSLNYNTDQAQITLFEEWMPRPNSLDDVDLSTIDRILKSRKVSLKDINNGSSTTE